jgi:hypothetical protein
MKLCALILAHHKPVMLARLTRRLTRCGIKSYAHIDARANLDEFLRNCEGADVSFLTSRQQIHWGGFSMIEAVVSLAREALSDQGFSHFIHLSGDSYPIKSDQQIIEMLGRDLDWIDLHEAAPGSLTFSRITNTYLPDSRIGALSQGMLHEERYVAKEVIDHLDEIRKVFEIKASQPFPWRYAKGANWWCLRRESLERCLDLIETKPDLVNWFRYSANPDESLFNSLILNFSDSAKYMPCPVHAIWNVRPAPYEFKDLTDLEKIRACQLPFCRKFSAQAPELLDALDSL